MLSQIGLPYIAEFFGTMFLVLLGDGVVANVNLNKSGMKGAGPVMITLGWGLAVMMPAFMFGTASGAHLNPVLSFALAVGGKFDWALLPGYCIAQMLGGFIGAFIVYALYKDQFAATEDPNTKLIVFCCRPVNVNFWGNMFAEGVGTFIMVFGICCISEVQLPGITAGLGKLFLFGIIASIGMSMGGLTGYALNPARDWGPRLAHTLLPIKDKSSSHWEYAPVTFFGPLFGALVAVLLYNAIPWTAA